MNSPLLERYLSPKQVETMFNLPVTSLEKWRSLKMGPPYMKRSEEHTSELQSH